MKPDEADWRRNEEQKLGGIPYHPKEDDDEEDWRREYERVNHGYEDDGKREYGGQDVGAGSGSSDKYENRPRMELYHDIAAFTVRGGGVGSKRLFSAT